MKRCLGLTTSPYSCLGLTLQSIIADLAVKMKRRDLSKLTDEEKKARKAKLSNLRKQRWRKKQKAIKRERGLYKNPRVMMPWMLRLVRAGAEHILALQQPLNTMEEFRQFLSGQGAQGSRLDSKLENNRRFYKTIHETISRVRHATLALVGT